jgi:hypothetical protein
MDHRDVQHQQKDYINNLFISELGADRGNDSHHPSMYGGALPSPSPSTMSPPNPVIPNVPLNLDIVTQLIGLQGQQAGSIGQGQYSPQLLLEQRLKLNQLQQLQLQNQILQQQVSRMIPTSLPRSHSLNSSIADIHSSNSLTAKGPRSPWRALASVRSLKIISSVSPHPVSAGYDSHHWRAKPIMSQSTLRSCTHSLAQVQTTFPPLPSIMSIPRTLDPTASLSSLPICTSHPIIYPSLTSLAPHQPTSSSTQRRLCPYLLLEN